MNKTRIYTEQSLTENEVVELAQAPSHHLASVLRMQEGARCCLFNGDGHEYEVVLLTVQKKKVCCQVLGRERVSNESPVKIHLGQVISRGERMDYAVQKAVECGVTEITPLLSSRCVVKLDAARARKRQTHWQAIAISAAEQSGRCYVPTVHPPAPLTNWIMGAPGIKFIGDTTCSTLLDRTQEVECASLLIGPEGGFNAEELALAAQHEFLSLSLGPRTLRTETATVVAISLLQASFGDL